MVCIALWGALCYGVHVRYGVHVEVRGAGSPLPFQGWNTGFSDLVKKTRFPGSSFEELFLTQFRAGP